MFNFLPMKFKGPTELLRKYLSGTASPGEKDKVEQWYESFEEKKPADSIPEKNIVDVKAKIYQRIQQELQLTNPVIPLYKRRAFLVSAAAVFFLVIAGTGLFFFDNRNGKDKPNTSLPKDAHKNDVAPPVSIKATLTLADGRKIELDSSGKGVLAVQGKTNVTKKDDGLIAYTGDAADTKITYNTLSVPRGSKPMKLLLTDETEVWLNVASSITYPTSFTGKERRVEITGEVYFEVAKNKSMPFIVKKANCDAEIKVLGTHFNVKAYDDEDAMKITLLEGSVDVSELDKHNVLLPGQQAIVANKKINVLNSVDLEEVMAWKNGRFYFDGANIKSIMRQVEKWYNVDIVYGSDIPYSFVAKISRNVNVSELFRILQLTELVHFKIEGNKITVMK